MESQVGPILRKTARLQEADSSALSGAPQMGKLSEKSLPNMRSTKGP